ncbi:hypothetical protein EV424DRAFT_1640443 [Suillus variegatus]|nr:hypothetical protein EV424DRAFT_1640443 [Suillus variegatus]
MSVSDTFGLQLAKYTNVAGLTILIYDYFVTLHSEVQWTWGRKWGITRTVFTFSRYGPFVCALMTLYSAIKTWGTQDCAPFNDALNGWSRLLSRHDLEMTFRRPTLLEHHCRRSFVDFQGLRLLWQKKGLSYKYPLIWFVTSVVISAAPINWRIPGGGPPCVMEGAHSSALPYALLMFFEIVLMSTTAFLRYRHYLGSHSALMKSVYRDGLLYMLCITMISTINVIVIAVLPLSYSETLNTPQIVAHSVLSSRILFNLQESMAQPLIPTYRSATSIEFNARPGDNIQTASQVDEA